MECALSTWERAVVGALASLDRDGGERVRESLPHLIVTGGCDCGCASFNVRDRRYQSQPNQLEHFSNGVVDASVGLVLWLGPDGRPISVDVENEPGVLPDPSRIAVSAPLTADLDGVDGTIGAI
jgi:hypothetical protein